MITGSMTYNRYRVRRDNTETGFVFESRNDQVSQILLIPGLRLIQSGVWLLFTGDWEDLGRWRDASTWNDGV